MVANNSLTLRWPTRVSLRPFRAPFLYRPDLPLFFLFLTLSPFGVRAMASRAHRQEGTAVLRPWWAAPPLEPQVGCGDKCATTGGRLLVSGGPRASLRIETQDAYNTNCRQMSAAKEAGREVTLATYMYTYMCKCVDACDMCYMLVFVSVCMSVCVVLRVIMSVRLCVGVRVYPSRR